MQKIILSTDITENTPAQRLDQALAHLFSDYSRSQWQQWIKQGFVKVDEKMITRTRYQIQAGQHIDICATLENKHQWQAQSQPLNIVYEDEDIIVINKPAGLIVHPGAGNPDATLVNALLHHAPELQQLPRGGIVHRLDKNTSGLLVIARNLTAHHYLVDAIAKRKIERLYRAIVTGNMIAGGSVDAPIGRHPKNRLKMAVVNQGKPALSEYRVLEKFQHYTYIQVKLASGRTHQIRVHMQHIHHPLVGDPVYGGRLQIPAKMSEELQHALHQFKRQALHAFQLSFLHPRTKMQMSWQALIPTDMQYLLDLLRKDDC